MVIFHLSVKNGAKEADRKSSIEKDFKKKCREQSLLAANTDAQDKSLDNLLDTAHSDIEGWT